MDQALVDVDKNMLVITEDLGDFVEQFEMKEFLIDLQIKCYYLG
jgi:hypothetical protein